MLQIPEKIKQARITAGKTQQEVANFLKIGRSTYANYENNIEPNVETILKISNFLGIDVLKLVNKEVTIYVLDHEG